MLSSHEVDTYGSNEHHFSLAHKAALHGRLPVIQFLVESGLPPSALQIPDDSFTTPAMLAIQVQPQYLLIGCQFYSYGDFAN